MEIAGLEPRRLRRFDVGGGARRRRARRCARRRKWPSRCASPKRSSRVSVKKLRPGVYIFDMGQNMVGWCRLRVSGPKGAQVTLRHAETLRARWLAVHRQSASARKATDIYTLKGGGARSLGAALHVSRIPLRRGDRLSRRAHARRARRPRGARRYGARRPNSPAPTSC